MSSSSMFAEGDAIGTAVDWARQIEKSNGKGKWKNGKTNPRTGARTMDMEKLMLDVENEKAAYHKTFASFNGQKGRWGRECQ